MVKTRVILNTNIKQVNKRRNNNKLTKKRLTKLTNQFKTTTFTNQPQPRLGRMLPNYRRYLNTRKQRITAAMRSGNGKQMRRAIHPYIQCRLTPFDSPANGLGIPDDTDAKRLVVDHRQVTSFVVGSTGAFNIVIAPTLPQVIWYNTIGVGDTTFKVNGYHPTYQNGGVGAFHPICLNQYSNLLLTRKNAAGNYNSFPLYLQATRARIVTIGYRIIYTGSTMNNSGSIMVNRLGLSCQPAIPNPATFKVLNDHGPTDEDYNVNQVLVVRTNMQTTFDSSVAETVRVPLRQGVTGLLKHGSGQYRWIDVTDNETYLAATGNDLFGILTQTQDNGVDNIKRWPSVTFIDDEWSPAAIAIRGATEGQTFDLETVFCIEYIPNIESDASSIAKQPPKPAPKVVEKGAELSKDAPLAGAASTFITLAKGAATLAPLIL